MQSSSAEIEIARSLRFAPGEVRKLVTASRHADQPFLRCETGIRKKERKLTNFATRSFSRLTAYEAARILHRIGADVRVFDPAGLPMKDEVSAKDEKVQELRALSEWSDGHFWVSPEQHGNVTGVFKTQSTSFRDSFCSSFFVLIDLSSRLDPVE